MNVFETTINLVVVVKKIVLLLAFVFLALPVLSTPTLGATTCYIDVGGDSCTETTGTVSAEIPPENIFTGYFCTDVPDCTQGCCCALPPASNPDAWNLDAGGLVKIRASCTALNPSTGPVEYEWNNAIDIGNDISGVNCVDYCGGFTDTTPAPTGIFIINGTVSNSTGPLTGATVRMAFTTLQSTTNSDGEYTILNVPEMDGQLVTTLPGCDPATEFITVDGNETQDFTLDCSTTICRPDANPGLTADTLKGTPDVSLTFSVGLSCGEPSSYNVIREDKTNGRGETFSVPYATQTTYIDQDLEPNTEYCYAVAAQYDTQLVPASKDERVEACITTGATECMNNAALEWCVNTPSSSVMSCTEENTLDERQCAEGQSCSYVGNNRYDCIAQPPCDECNGLFGMLSNNVYSLFFLGTERSCDSLDIQNFCFKDTTQTTIDAYRSCGEVTNCEDYRTQTQCGNNPCVLPASCSWKEIFPEIGRGICQSTDQPPACDSCEDIFGTCNTKLCEDIGLRPGQTTSDCYYDAETNGLDYSELSSRCRSKEEVACRYYDTQEDCGTTPPVIAAMYSGETRTGTTHEVTTQGNDRFGIGLCKWQSVPESSSGGFCYKDADAYNYLSPEDDCIDNGVFAARGGAVGCLQDAIPPVTSIILSENVLGMHEVASLDFVISDNYYTSEELRGNTRFCIYETSQTPCYPDKTLTEAVAALPDMVVGEQGSFGIRYYSFDYSGNLEVVKETPVTLIELGVPRVESAELRE